jgi:hypothetical protein
MQGRLDHIEQGPRCGAGRFLIAKTLDPHTDRFDMMIALEILQLPPGQHGHGIVERHVVYECALELDPNLAPAWFNKGVTLFNAFQRYAEALARFEAAERLQYPPAAEGIALCRQALGQG